MSALLSKSQFIRGLQCHKSLWLFKNAPELRAEPGESTQAVFDSGTEVGRLAQQLFPGGELIELEGSNLGEKVERTKSLIENGVETIYEATFCHDNNLVMGDILHKSTDGWEIYEVKQSTEIKEVHKNDIAVQYLVVSGSGLPVSRVSLVYINNGYVRNGDIDVRELFHIENLTADVLERQPFVKDEIQKMRQMLTGNCPTIDIGPHCGNPYECDFKAHCRAHIPENSVFDLSGKGIDQFAYYRAGKIRFEELDLDELNFRQRMQVDAELNGTVTLDKEGVSEFLDTLHYPLYFLDFEAIYNEPVPPFDGTWPYMKIPFQYSLHWIEKDGHRLQHREFLGSVGEDAREEIARQLSELIPDNACILAYNMTFEKGVIAALADCFPAYSEKLLRINENMKDLMAPFRSRHYYTKEMNGSYSIKLVLPALVPELSYEGMAVANGDDAVLAYKQLGQTVNPAEAEQIRRDLLEYCKLDTLAMVKLLERLKALSE